MPGGRLPQSTPISELFEDQLYTDLFNARCHDTGEATSRKYQAFCDSLSLVMLDINRFMCFNSGERQDFQGRTVEKECQKFKYA